MYEKGLAYGQNPQASTTVDPWQWEIPPLYCDPWLPETADGAEIWGQERGQQPWAGVPEEVNRRKVSTDAGSLR